MRNEGQVYLQHKHHTASIIIHLFIDRLFVVTFHLRLVLDLRQTGRKVS